MNILQQKEAIDQQMNDYVRSAKRAKRTRSAGRRRKRTQIAR